MKQKTLRLFITLVIVAALIVGGYFLLKASGLWERFDSAEEIKEFILSGGVFSYAVFFFIQFVQVTFIPIPAFITTVAGTLVFGPWVTTFISIIAQMLGAILAFVIGRKLGRKVVAWIAGDEQTKKWETELGKGKYVFFLMMLFPFFPDDILCLIAGLTTMSFKFFTITNLITRPIAIICTCFLGSGYLIPFEGYWLILWGVMVGGVITLLVLSFVYQEKIEKYVLGLAEKIKRKKPSQGDKEKEKK